MDPQRFGEVLGLLREIGAAPTDIGGIQRLLARIAGLLRAEQAVLLVRNPLTQDLDTILHNHDPELCRSYADYYYKLDPGRLRDGLRDDRYALPQPPARVVFDLHDLVDYGSFVHSEYYNDFFRRGDMHHDLLTSISSSRTVRGGLCLFRSRRRNPFSPEDVATMEVVAPFLSNHLERALAANVVTFLEAVEDEGIIVCDSNGRVLYCNDIARTFCAPPIRVEGDRQHAGAIGDRAVSPTDSTGPSESLPHSATGPFVGYVLADPEALSEGRDIDVNIREVDLGRTGTGRIIVLRPRDCRAQYRHEHLGDRFRLTRREIEVLDCVMAGATNREIAQTLFISERTVKWHMQGIAAKVGARTRTAIVHVVHEELALIR